MPLSDGSSITLVEYSENKGMIYLVDQTKDGKDTQFWSGPSASLVSCDIKENDISVLIQIDPIYLAHQLIQYNRETKIKSETIIPFSRKLRRVREFARDFRVIVPNLLLIEDIVGNTAKFTIQNDGRLLNSKGVEVFPMKKINPEDMSELTKPITSELTELELGHDTATEASAAFGVKDVTFKIKDVSVPQTTEKSSLSTWLIFLGLILTLSGIFYLMRRKSG